MSEILLQNIDETIMSELQKNAKNTGISPEHLIIQLLHDQLVKSPPKNKPGHDDVLDLADSIRAKYSHRQRTDSTLLIREQRDQR